MSGRCGQSMLLDDSNFPVAILRVLTEERTEGGARRIPALDPGRLEDPAPGSRNSQIEFVVFVPRQLFIEESKSVEDLPTPTAEINGVDRPRIGGVMSAGRSSAKW